jgi:4-hydroxy-2-oxoheptanedioate aldolase
MLNTLKALVESGRPAIGSWIGFTDPYSVEALADAGFDWLLIDTEHFPISRESLRTILVAMKGSPSVPVVRLPSNAPDHFQTALDLGAQGVVVPMVNSPQDAAQAVTFCRYPPLGTRGFSPTRASRYFHDLEQYAAAANGQIFLIVQIETPQAVANIDGILATKGIDGIFIGPSDLASFMNLPARTNHPDVERVVGQLIDSACARVDAVWLADVDSGGMLELRETRRTPAHAGQRSVLSFKQRPNRALRNSSTAGCEPRRRFGSARDAARRRAVARTPGARGRRGVSMLWREISFLCRRVPYDRTSE